MHLGEYAVKKAVKLGMSEVEAYIKKTKTINVLFADEIHNMKTVDSYGIGIRVIDGKKVAVQSSSIYTKEEVDSCVEKAVSIARASPEDPNWNSLPNKYGSTTVEGVNDKVIENLSYDELNDTIIATINRASENDRKVKVTRGSITVTSSTTSIINNYNDIIERQSTGVTFGINVKAIEGGESTGSEYQQTRYWKKMDFMGLTDKAADKSLKYINAKAIASTKMPVILDNQLSANILGIMIAPNISSESIQKGRSILAQKINTQIACEDFTVIDDGTKKDGVFTREFDDDGIPTQKTEIISKGVLKNFIYDHYRAAKENIPSTGNAGRQYWSAPGPTTNNFILKAGSISREEMIRDTKQGILIEDTIGEWLSRPESGELNATITHGYLIENGELTKPITNVVISGNYFDILMNKIEAFGNDSNNAGKVYSPTIKISELTIAGK
ncbi:MAG: TldD/PmbA family protein [Candidatus Thorarchaeota archaeon]